LLIRLIKVFKKKLFNTMGICIVFFYMFLRIEGTLPFYGRDIALLGYREQNKDNNIRLFFAGWNLSSF